MYGHDFVCKICGYTCDSDHEVCDGLHVCTDCVSAKKHRLWRWQQSAHERGLYDLHKIERVKVNDSRASQS